jgi:hypothetical protein
MISWTVSHLINTIGLFLGLWLGGSLSRRLKGQAFIAVLLGFGIAFLACELPLPRAYVSLATAAYSMFFVVGLVLIKDVVVDLWIARRCVATTPMIAESSGLSPRVEALIASGRKIEAIKAYREETGVGLKEAKEAVDNGYQLSS